MLNMLLSYSPYIPWDVSLLYKAIADLREKFGTAVNIGMWIFIIISGVYLVLKLVDGIGQ